MVFGKFSPIFRLLLLDCVLSVYVSRDFSLEILQKNLLYILSYDDSGALILVSKTILMYPPAGGPEILEKNLKFDSRQKILGK